MMKKITIAQIAALTGGNVVGDEGLVITGAAAFEQAAADEITYAVQAGFLKRVDESGAGAVIIPEDFPCDSRKVLLRIHNPELAFAKILEFFHPKSMPVPGIHPSAVIGGNVKLGSGIAIGASAVIGDDVEIGDGTVIGPGVYIGDRVCIGGDVFIFPNTTVMERCRIGNRVTIHAGTVIGCDGFGYTQDKGRYHKIPHVGNVRIDDDVEIGANNTIDRGRFGSTWVRKGVKTDNLVHIAHNVVVGENTVLVAQVGISGSVHIGNNAIIAGQAGVAGHLRIGDHAIVGPRAGVAKTVDDGVVVSGDGPLPHKLWLKTQKIIPRLPEMMKRIRALEKRIAGIEKTQD